MWPMRYSAHTRVPFPFSERMSKRPPVLSAEYLNSGSPMPTLRVVRVVGEGVGDAGEHLRIHAAAVIFDADGKGVRRKADIQRDADELCPRRKGIFGDVEDV